MKEFKGTKGEWKITDDVYITPLSENFAIARAFTGSESISTSKIERLANAKLIAAAPELLKALLEIKKILKKEWPKQEWDDFANEETSFTKAINKALN